ncbi:MAG: ABC transporter permease [Ardenticatenaceae bacterium]|nr:ABC transporter permease [Ardenticatenaceae bacterium]
MIRLISTKSLLILFLLPILHAVGYQYAINHPSFFRPGGRDPEAYGGYFDYLGRIIFQGNFGEVGGAQINELVSKPFVNSLILIVFSMAIVGILGILIGFISISPNTMRTRPTAFLIISAGASIPGFLLGGVVIAIIVFQTLYGGLSQTWLPMSGCGEGTPLPFSSCSLDRHLILPLIVLAVRPTLHVARVTTSLLENELQKNYIRTARSKGARWYRVFRKHAFKNIFAPVIVLLGQSLRYVVGGLLIAEIMFFWPGIGRFFVFSIIANENLSAQSRFFAHPELIATLTFLLGFLILTADLIAAAAAYAADPRLRQQN